MLSHFLLSIMRRPIYMYNLRCFLAVFMILLGMASALQPSQRAPRTFLARRNDDLLRSRRSAFGTSLLLGVGLFTSVPSPSFAAGPNGLPLTTAPSGLRWADAKVGSGQPITSGFLVSIDYSMASTAGRFPQIYTTKDKGQPYRWTLGDGSTIKGIEMAIIGDENDNIPPMLPGGVRRVIIPSFLGYEGLSAPNAKCTEGVGPIPPKEDIGAYQRWVQFYCNPRIPYQPDLIIDIKLYGKR